MKKKTLLPLLSVLKSISPQKRIILLAHFDDETRDGLCKTIVEVQSSPKIPFYRRNSIRKCLAPYKKHLNVIASKGNSRASKKKRLAQMGGGAMTKVLKTAVPLMLNLFQK